MKNILRTMIMILAFIMAIGCGFERQLETNAYALTGAAPVGVNSLTYSLASIPGIGLDGIGANGVDAAGLSSNSAFGTWCNADLARCDAIMGQAIGCALSSGNSTTFTDASSVVHTWNGLAGLAPNWDTTPLNASDTQFVGACVASHVSSNGKSLQISIRGNKTGLASTAVERSILSTHGGVYFGDFSTGVGPVYACSTAAMNSTNYSSVLANEGRDCPLAGSPCVSVITPVDCATVCTAAPGGSDRVYDDCTVSGVTYHGISVYGPLGRYAADSQWVTSGGAFVGTQTGAYKTKAITFGTSGAATAGTGWNAFAGTYSLQVRYAASATKYLKLFVNGTQVMNPARGDGLWTFPSTGGTTIYGRQTIVVTLPALPSIKLQASGSGSLAAPLVDSAYLEF